MSPVRKIEIAPEDAGQRLDRWLRRQFPHVPQGRIEKMCRKGEIRLDGGRVKPGQRIEAGQTVRVPPMPAPESRVRALPALRSVSEADARMIRACVIYQDEHILALNKPPGLPVQGGTGQSRHVDALAEALRFGAAEPPRLVHRLDKDTSGVLLMARTRSAARALTRAFRDRDARKIYWAAVAGVPNPRMGTIRYGLVKAAGHGRGGEGEKMRCIHPRTVSQTEGAKRAITDYAVLSALGRRVSWAALVLVTGRTHQLRAHMAEIGHPIIGDGKYGGPGQENRGEGWGAQLGGGISRKLHLHARSIRLGHPVSGKPLWIEAPLPAHMRNTWKFLGWCEDDAPEDPFDGEMR